MYPQYSVHGGMGSTHNLLLFTSLFTFLLTFARNNFTQHHNTISVHKCNTRKALAILERVADKWLLRLETALCHFVGLQRMRIFHFFAAGLLAHFPLQL